ncbi:phosphoenolpyruvate carboxykinase [bacterium]|nr:phosphoenolpyruvate carboxykinase [bacterium]
MQEPYDICDDKVLIDFEALYCDSAEKLLKSGLFCDMLNRYLAYLKRRQSPMIMRLGQHCAMPLERHLATIIRLLATHAHDEIADVNAAYGPLMDQRETVYEFVEGLYDYWRRFERYLIIEAPEHTRLRTRVSIYPAQFIQSNEMLKQIILNTYRTVCAHLYDDPFRVFRQLPAGADVGFMTQHINWQAPAFCLPLTEVPFIRMALLEPPVIFNTKRNTRKGLFEEVQENPFNHVKLNTDDWFCYPAKVGKLLAFIYFHKSFMSQGAALSNLFELAHFEDIHNMKPDLVFCFGGPDLPFKTELGTVFYQDDNAGMMIGYNVASDDIDYFGYMKKMLLTLHNVHMINRGRLPVHGAMVSIRLQDQRSANVVIIGDSGAGKSETLEAFRMLGRDQISEMTVIFDDMGSLAVDEETGEIRAYGTEIGAFLRLDDLQPGYAFEQMDRSIFMNANLTNARVILPVTSYKQIVEGVPIDLFLYANNFEAVSDDNKAFVAIENTEQAYSIFSSGRRMAMGTTSEKGIVDSYFANPFGAPQRKEDHDKIARKMLKKMFKDGIRVGQLFTQLGMDGMSQTGPKIAAKALLDEL